MDISVAFLSVKILKICRVKEVVLLLLSPLYNCKLYAEFFTTTKKTFCHIARIPALMRILFSCFLLNKRAVIISNGRVEVEKKIFSILKNFYPT